MGKQFSLTRYGGMMPGRRGWSTNWTRWIALAGAVALLAVVAVSVVTIADDESFPGADLAAANQVQDRLAQLQSMIGGTVTQRSAGAYLEYVAETAQVKKCMAGKGEQYRYPFIDPFAGRPEYTGIGGSWDEPLMATQSSTFALFDARYQWKSDKHWADNVDWNWNHQTPSFRHAYRQCRYLREHYSGKPRDGHLLSDLYQLVYSIDDDFGPTSVYDECMREKGHEVYWDDFGGPDAMHQTVQDQAPTTDLPPKKLVKTGEWARFLEFEQEVLTADYDCRAPKYVQVMGELDAPLEQFETTNQTEIARLQEEWEQVAAEAEHQGWTPPDDS